MKLKKIRVVKSPVRASKAGTFFTVESYRLQNEYGDRKPSPVYTCESVHRRGTDGVAVCIYRVEKETEGHAEILLKECIRPPLLLREKRIEEERPNPPILLEVVAGSREPEDKTPWALRQRAAAEVREEAGIWVTANRVRPMGPPVFTSPGGLSEEVHIYSCDVTGLPERGLELDKVHPLEMHSVLHWVSLDIARRWILDGTIRDAKTEIAIRRLIDMRTK